MTVLASVSGTRIDCDRCGTHAASPDLSLPVLRRAAGFSRLGDVDLCRDCALDASKSGAMEPRSAAASTTSP